MSDSLTNLYCIDLLYIIVSEDE